MTRDRFDALVLAAGRGPDDPMARASGTTHKCLLDIAGTPMIMRVLNALTASRSVNRILVSIEDPSIIADAPGYQALAGQHPIETIPSASQASSSVARALRSGDLAFPVLVTTADHALLSASIVDQFCDQSRETNADLTVGLASAETILGAYPGSARTFLKFAGARYSGCNLFTFNSENALKAVDFWQRVERDRKQPWRLIKAFGLSPLLAYLTGRLTLEAAFEKGSVRLGTTARPVVLPIAEAAIDVDKPTDLELVNAILSARSGGSAS